MNSILTGVLLLFFPSDMSFTEITEVYLLFVSSTFLFISFLILLSYLQRIILLT